MKVIFRLTFAFLVSSIITFSCSSSQQLTCPDYSDNAKLKHKTSQAYKPNKYKPPKINRRHRVKPIKVNPSNVQAVNTGKSTIEAANIEERSIEIPTMANVLEPINTVSIEHPSTYANNDLDIKPEKYGISAEAVSYEDIIQKYSVTAQNEVITSPIASNVQAEVVNEEASDAIKSPVPTVTSRKSKRQTLRNLRRSINNYIEAEPGGEAKPVTGFAVSALVLGIVSLFVFPFIAGPLAIIFGGIALKRAESNPNKEGRGLAIAGLVCGIVGTVGGLILLFI
jgi:hypothetical protein